MTAVELEDSRNQRLAGTDYDARELRKLTATVVGVGAVGGEVIKHLTLLNIGRIYAIDYDRVEESNLSRSVLLASAGRQPRTGEHKVHVAASVVESWNSSVKLIPLPYRVQDIDLGPFLLADVVFSCVDSRAARIHTTIQAIRAGAPIAEGGMYPDRFESYEVVVADPVVGPCGGICRYEELREHAVSEILPEHFYEREGCSLAVLNARKLAPAVQDVGSVASLSMTASIVAAQEVLLGLQRVRERHEAPNASATHIKMTAAVSGEQFLKPDKFGVCADCPSGLKEARAQGARVRGARSRTVTFSRPLEHATLDDVRAAGAAALGVAPREVSVVLDPGIAVQWFCPGEGCKFELSRAHVAPRLDGVRCPHHEAPLQPYRLLSYSDALGDEIAARMRSVSLAELGYKMFPGWIVESQVEGEAEQSALVVHDPVGLPAPQKT